jgi:hypothetical protein
MSEYVQRSSAQTAQHILSLALLYAVFFTANSFPPLNKTSTATTTTTTTTMTAAAAVYLGQLVASFTSLEYSKITEK